MSLNSESNSLLSDKSNANKPIIYPNQSGANDRSKTKHKYDEQSTQPFINNQNTVLMAARSCDGYLMLMHETRIFYFKYSGDEESMDNQPDYDKIYGQQADHLMKVILGILTTRKYRLLQSFYILSRVLDYSMLVALILLLFFDKNHASFENIFGNYIFIFIVVILEIFYDVLEFIVKIWILNRLSIYIGVVLYILYAISLIHYGKHTDMTVDILFGLRFTAFVLEEATDYCIDLELEYDLNTGRGIHKLEVPQCIKKCFGRCCEACTGPIRERLAMLYVTDYDIDMGSIDWEFGGTRCVWTTDNVYCCDVSKKKKINPRSYRWFFDILFIITYGVLAIPLFIVMGVVVGIIACVRCCFRCKGKSIYHEMCDPNSY